MTGKRAWARALTKKAWKSGPGKMTSGKRPGKSDWEMAREKITWTKGGTCPGKWSGKRDLGMGLGRGMGRGGYACPKLARQDPFAMLYVVSLSSHAYQEVFSI